MAHRKRRVDSNQNEIVKALISMGYSVADTSHAGSGFPDIVIARAGGDAKLVEIKNPEGHRNRLTQKQQEFHTRWKGRLYVIESVDQAIEAFA